MSNIELKKVGCDYGKIILVAITDCLETEERRLKPRSGRRLWPWTVRGGYNEDWVRYLLVKKLTDRFPKQELGLETESGSISYLDLLICGRATVELKGPLRVRQNEKFYKPLYRKVLRDFEKQQSRATQEPSLQHFVLLIVHAPESEFDFVQRWLTQLESDVRQEVAGISINCKKSAPLALNDNEQLMQCCLYEVR